MANYHNPVVFKLGNEYYGVDINLVIGIEKELNVIPVPNSVDYIKGIINLRGEVIPVYNLKHKFGMKDNGISGVNMVIIRMNDVVVALDVDQVEKIDNLEPENVVPMPPLVKNEDTQYFDRVANVSGQIMVLLDVNYLLTEKEKEAVKTVKEEMEK